MAARDAEQTIEAQLEALSKQTYEGNWDVVISDNGSRDSTVEIARAWDNSLPGLRIVDSSSAPGPAHARNVAAALAGDVIAVCDADDVVDVTWLAELVAGLETADLVGGAVDHKLLNDPSTSDWRGGGEAALPQTFRFLPYVVTCNCAFRRSLWTQLGGWSLEYARGGGEDVDFSWRAQLRGFRIAFAPAAVVHYRHRGGLWATARQVYFYSREEVQLLRDFRRHGASRRTVRDIVASYLYLLIRLPYLLLSQRRRGFWVLTAASNVGRLAGSIRYRVFAP